MKKPVVTTLILLIGFQACVLDDEDYPVLEFFEVNTDNVFVNGGTLFLEASVSGLEGNAFLNYGFRFFEEGSDTPVDSITGAQTFSPSESGINIAISVENLDEHTSGQLEVLCPYEVQAYVYQTGGRRTTGQKVRLDFTNQLFLEVLKEAGAIKNDTIILSARVFGLENLDLEVEDHGYYYAAAPFDENNLPPDENKISLNGRSESGNFEERKVFGLDFNTTYHTRAFIESGGKTYLSAIKEFAVRDGWTFFKNTIFPVAKGIAVSLGDKAFFGLGSASTSGVNPSKDFWVMDADTNISELTTLPETAMYRTDAIAFVIGDTIYYGTGQNINAFEAYDDLWAFYPSENKGNGRWEKWDQDPIPGGGRHEAVAFTIGRKAYVGGGRNQFFEINDDFYVFDPDKEEGSRWDTLENLPTGRANAIGFSIGSKGYTGFGVDEKNDVLGDFYEFIPDGGRGNWNRLDMDDLPGKRRSAVSFVIGNKGYVGTGIRSFNANPSEFLDDFWQFNPLKAPGDQWTRVSTFIDKKRYEAMGFSINGIGFLFGGITHDGFNDDTSTGIWQYTPPNQ